MANDKDKSFVDPLQQLLSIYSTKCITNLAIIPFQKKEVEFYFHHGYFSGSERDKVKGTHTTKSGVVGPGSGSRDLSSGNIVCGKRMQQGNINPTKSNKRQGRVNENKMISPSRPLRDRTSPKRYG